MDSLGKKLNNLSLYEVKAYVRKAQNAVLNLSEIEAKVREATNNEPWGTSTSTMSEIARGTFSYPEREEICAMIFRRFTEKSAHEWRQIYKALQLMEYLVKHGSERFVDDARANVNLVSMLKSFHYIDSKGVDQGINVRNRARELIALLNDESKIRQERKKAKENAKKFGAVSSNSAFVGSSSFRRTGSASADYDYDEDAGYAGRVFGDGGVFGQRFEEQTPAGGSRKFEEYDIEEPSTTRRTSKPSVQASSVTATTQPNVDLFSFDDKPAATSTASGAAENGDDDDEDFDDFQSASAPAVAPAQAQSTNLADLLSASYSQPATSTPTPAFQAQPTPSFSVPTPAIAQPKKQDDLFGNLLVSAKSKAHTPSSSTTPAKAATASPQAAADDDFGLFSPAPTQQSNGATSGNSQNNGTVDLLSF